MSQEIVLGSRENGRLLGPEIMEIARSSVVRICVELGGQVIGHGSAFAYKQIIRGADSKIYFLTNLHNFSKSLGGFSEILRRAAMGAPDELLRMRAFIDLQGERHEVSDIVAIKGALFSRGFPPQMDFAIFAVESDFKEKLRMFSLPDAGEARAGEEIFALGYPRNTELGITEGIVSHVYGDSSEENHQWQIQHSIALNPGNSGGPTVNSHGVAIGISTWGYRDMSGINFSVNVHRALSMCEDPNGIEKISITGVYDRFVTRAREEVRFGS